MADFPFPAYTCPAAGATSEDTLLAWLREQVKDGENYLERQRAFQDIDRAIDRISGYTDEEIPTYRSDVKISEIKRVISQVVAVLTDLRIIGNVKTDDPVKWQQQADDLNKLFLAWYLNTFVDLKIEEALDYAAVMGTGYLGMRWARDLWGFGKGDAVLDSYGARDVVPIQMGRHHDIQRCYGVVIRCETPINEALAMYPQFRGKIAPDRATPVGLKKSGNKLGMYMSTVLNLFGPGRKKEDDEGPTPVVDIYNCYLLDTSINMTGAPVHMGDPLTGWDYVVPFLGQDIPEGETSDMFGNRRQTFRKATEEDCLFYPRRRLIVFTNTCIISDGPSPWWHGKVPLIKFDLDKWPWEYLGYSLARGQISLEQASNQLLRGFVDAINLKLRPPHVIDENAASDQLADRWDVREPGAELRANLMMNPDVVKFPIPPGQYDIPPGAQDVLAGLIDRIGKQAGSVDLEALARARQIPSGDAVEKIVEAIGPLARKMSRALERPLRDLGEFFISMVFQYYTVGRRIQSMGPDAVTEEDWDFDPATLVPSHLPGEEKLREMGESSRLATRYERAQWHLKNFRYHITPNSLHQINQVSRKLLMVQLYKLDFIDPWTLAEALDIPNFGPPPEGTNTVMERLVAWMRMKMEMQAEAAQMIQGVQAAIGGLTGAPPAGGGGGGGGGGPVGRPPENRKMPQLQTKSGPEGQRVTMKTT